ncbi:MAG: DUF167 domain-containing protein [Anaerolineales bacterium]|nr:DUF167 domain-containing protein [Anaerolineales bacterium]
MEARQFHLHNGKKGAAIAVRITPRASKNEISDILDDGTVKIRLTASANESKINQALVDFLANILEIPAASIEIVAGAVGKDKLVSILDLDAATVQQRILRKIS